MTFIPIFNINIMKYPQPVPLPTAVSEWLEEQLEARGIDAVLYTRYILSLLHSHTLDVIYPDEDLFFSRLNKEVKRSSGGRKRFRRSSDWWRHAQADAEQIKRSAAVECLMSASDQNCEIESLVDELCEKLKEVKSVSSSSLSSNDTTSTTVITEQKITPQELAEKYYAAFPPLCPLPPKLIPMQQPNLLWPNSPSKLTQPQATTSPIKSTNVRKKCSRRLQFDDDNAVTQADNQNTSSLNSTSHNEAGINNSKAELIRDLGVDVLNGNSPKPKGVLNVKEIIEKSVVDQATEVESDRSNDDDEMNTEHLVTGIEKLLESPDSSNKTVEMIMGNKRDSGERNVIETMIQVNNENMPFRYTCPNISQGISCRLTSEADMSMNNNWSLGDLNDSSRIENGLAKAEGGSDIKEIMKKYIADQCAEQNFRFTDLIHFLTFNHHLLDLQACVKKLTIIRENGIDNNYNDGLDDIFSNKNGFSNVKGASNIQEIIEKSNADQCTEHNNDRSNDDIENDKSTDLANLLASSRNSFATSVNVKRMTNIQDNGKENVIDENYNMIQANDQNESRLNSFRQDICGGISRRGTSEAMTINNWSLNGLDDISSNKNGLSNAKGAIIEKSDADQCAGGRSNDDLVSNVEELMTSPLFPPSKSANMGNIRDKSKKNFIPYSINIGSGSIWSDTFHASVSDAWTEPMLEAKSLSSVKTNQTKSEEGNWAALGAVSENNTNSSTENGEKKPWLQEYFHGLPDNWMQRGLSDTKICVEKFEQVLQIGGSRKINHDKERSNFAEVPPGYLSGLQALYSFNSTSMFNFNSMHNRGADKEKENLPKTQSTHFRPINGCSLGPYDDGTTFAVSNNLTDVDYKRSASGSMMVDNEYGQNKKYLVYKQGDLTLSESVRDFMVKFMFCQNDKACETDEQSELDFDTVRWTPVESGLDYDEEYSDDEVSDCPTDEINTILSRDNFTGNRQGHPASPESMLSEESWNYETNVCEKCKNTTWTSNWMRDSQVESDWDNDSLRSIWNDGEVSEGSVTPKCIGCRWSFNQQAQLREDICQDEEQLFSDLSTLQHYMNELPSTEISCNISELVSDITPNDRKRRHSFITSHGDEPDYSFPTVLEDCRIQVATFPTLRSVTY